MIKTLQMLRKLKELKQEHAKSVSKKSPFEHQQIMGKFSAARIEVETNGPICRKRTCKI
jgi:hypothetical protein